MRKPILLGVFLFFSVMISTGQFTTGNIAVLQAEASANNTTGAVIELNKTTAGQTPVSTVVIDGAGVNALRFSGSATSTGYLANSNDGTLLCFTGANNTNTSSNVNTLNPRGVGTLNSSQVFNLSTTYTGISGQQTRCAASLNNSTWYIADQAGIYANGTSAASPAGNFRGLKFFGATAYVGSASGSPTVQVSTLSAPVGGTVTGLPGLANNATHQDFYMISSGDNGATFDILYVLSATSNTAGSIAKFSLVSGSWVANGTYTTTFGGFGIAAEKNGTGARLYVSTGQGALAANSVIRLTDDAGYNAAINITTGSNITLYTAPAGKIIKGVAFTPTAAVSNPTVTLSVNTSSASETAATVVTVTATASANVSGSQTVDIAVGGTNITAGDYNLSGASITIPNGQASGSVTFTIVDDAAVEGQETATLTISNPSSGITLGSPIAQNVVIDDNDVVLPTVDLSASLNSGSESAGTAITVTATASAPVSGNQIVTLGVSGTNITATDYALSATTITILNGQTTGTAIFTVRNDAETEGTETAVLTISNPSSGITLGATTSQNISIADNTCQVLIRKSTATSVNGAEISAFDPASSRIYTVAGPAVEYYTLNNTGMLSSPSSVPFGFAPPVNTTALPNSVAIKNGVAVISYAIVNNSSSAQEQGIVAFYTAATGTYIHHVTVGYLPDMVIYSPDGTKVLTANEGEPNSYGQGNSFDPEGSVSIIDISGGILSATVQNAGFTSFNAQITTLRAAGVRIYGPGATVAQDLEPEYITFSGDGNKAIVTLQENNALAEVDIETATVLQIIPLGLKNHNLSGNGLDASDRDLAPGFTTGTINIQNWPIYGMYQPDAISSFTVGGNTYYITANEGDSRAWTGYTEEIRVSAGGYTLDPAVFPNATTLKLNQNLGRLQLTNATGDIDADGDFDQIHTLGARSFSIWNSTYAQIFDSGDQLEQISAQQNPAVFNSDGTAATFDSRSDNKGPEVEAATTGTVNGVLYAFVGSERTGDIFIYNISNPAAPVFLQYIDHPADLGVEGLTFIPANESPTGKALVMATSEVSRTVTIYEFSLVSSSLATVYTSVQTVQGAVTSFGTCTSLVASVTQSGASPVSGQVDAAVWIETAQPADFVKRHYEITPASNPATSTGTVTLYFTQQEFDDFNVVNTVKLPMNSGDAAGKTNLLIEKRAGTSNNGTGLPSSYTGDVSTINPNDANIVWNSTDNRWEVTFDVTGFSGFFVKTIGGVLPLNWITVNGRLNSQRHAVIEWKVVENSIDKYTIEKSVNGIDYILLGIENSKGDGVNSYTFTEPFNLNGTAFYRIKQSDRLGRFSYSPVIRLTNNVSDLIKVYPNPSASNFTVMVSGSLQNTTTVRLTDMSGKVLKLIQLTGQSTFVNTDKLPAGMYLLRFNNGQTSKLIKF